MPRPGFEAAEFDLHAFDQGEQWVDIDGEVHHIAELDAARRAALADWLTRNARHFYLQVLDRELTMFTVLSLTRVPELVFLSSEEWVRRTPLMQALESPDR